jgi:tellurite resistance protein
MSLGVLIGRFGDFVRARHDPHPSAPSVTEEFPEIIAPLRGCAAHHLIPLALLSGVDSECAQSERDAIVVYCLSIAERRGISVSDAERMAFAGHVAEFRPSLMQLDPALELLERESAEDIALLFAAAEAVVGADGKLDPAEQKLLDELKSEVAKPRP